MTEQKSGKKHRRQRHCQCCKTKNMANYNVPYGLVTLVPGPFVCLQATMMDVIALHFMCEIVGQLKREASAVARRIKFFVRLF
jgi:hypothetical protein